MRNRLIKPALTAVFAAGAAAGVAMLPAAGAASAATQSHATVTATARDTRYQAPDFYIFAPVYAGAPLFRPDNALAATLPAGDHVQVTCWYYGNMPGYAGDGYEDHVVWVFTLGNFTGHIPDDYVDLGGTPNNEGIPECG